MGLKTIDLAPLQITPITPAFKDLQIRAFQVARTDTVASVKAMLPADSTVIDIKIVGVASNAATTATLSIGTTSTATEWINAQDVKTAGGMIRPTTTYSAVNLPNVESLPLGSDIQIFAKYAETGTASTLGGPYTVIVEFVR